jgi:hypothetical protein
VRWSPGTDLALFGDGGLVISNVSSRLLHATLRPSELVTATLTGQENFRPKYSPDGKEVGYFENRTTLRALNLESKQILLTTDSVYRHRSPISSHL